MQPHLCPCGTEHWNPSQLCDYCAEERHEAFELRLRTDDKSSWMVVAAWALWGEREQSERRWEVR